MYLGFNILQILLATNCYKVRWLSHKINQGVHELGWTLISFRNKKVCMEACPFILKIQVEKAPTFFGLST